MVECLWAKKRNKIWGGRVKIIIITFALVLYYIAIQESLYCIVLVLLEKGQNCLQVKMLGYQYKVKDLQKKGKISFQKPTSNCNQLRILQWSL